MVFSDAVDSLRSDLGILETKSTWSTPFESNSTPHHMNIYGSTFLNQPLKLTPSNAGPGTLVSMESSNATHVPDQFLPCCPKHLDLMSGWTTDVGSLG